MHSSVEGFVDGRVLRPDEVLASIPQQDPFRFVDSIDEIDDVHIVSRYRFKQNASFYAGHFPDNPITPGVILIETMAQAGVVAHGIYLLAKELPPDELKKIVTVFTHASIEFSAIVRPEEQVIVHSRKLYFRRRKLCSEVEMRSEVGSLICRGSIAGMGVLQ